MMLIDEGDHHFGRQSSSACAKNADAFRDGMLETAVRRTGGGSRKQAAEVYTMAEEHETKPRSIRARIVRQCVGTAALAELLAYYNRQRPHASLNYRNSRSQLCAA
jgi:hypothetical protein